MMNVPPLSHCLSHFLSISQFLKDYLLFTTCITKGLSLVADTAPGQTHTCTLSHLDDCWWNWTTGSGNFELNLLRSNESEWTKNWRANGCFWFCVRPIYVIWALWGGAYQRAAPEPHPRLVLWLAIKSQNWNHRTLWLADSISKGRTPKYGMWYAIYVKVLTLHKIFGKPCFISKYDLFWTIT